MSEARSVYFDLHERLQHAILHRLRWRELRPVQELTIRGVQAEKNLVVLAPTAGGKTEAAMFGVLDGLLRRRGSALRALYLSPLRALLNNQEPRIQNLSSMVGLSAFKWHGDVSAAAKAKFAKAPSPILMTTPESLQVILMTDRYDQAALFSNLDYIIIDEIHGFAGDDRGDHLIVLLEHLKSLSKDFLRIGLSATVGNPEMLLEWVGGSSARAGEVIKPPAPREQKILQVLPLPEGVDPAATTALLARGKKSLIFADSRARVEKLKAGLERSGVRAFLHHGSLSRELRERSEEAFRSGTNCAIVSTSTLELGLDVGDLDLVLQLESPNTVSAFLQRLGRSGRRAGTTARMTFLCGKPESFLTACALISLAMKRWVEPVEPSRVSYPIFVHQVLTTVLAQSGATRKALLASIGSPYCFSQISIEDKERILDEMLDQRVLVVSDSLYLIGPEGERRFGRSNFMSLYSVFETPPLLSVRTAANREIGHLEAWFVLSSEESATFLLGGKAWRVVKVDWNRAVLTVAPAPRGTVPTWMGEPALLSQELCQEVLSILRDGDSPPYLGDRGKAELLRLREEWSDITGLGHFAFDSSQKGTILHTFCGGKINNVIARYHHRRTGQKTSADNFVVRSAGDAPSLQESLEVLADLPPDSQNLAEMMADLQRSRLSKFQQCLPPDLEARYVFSRLFDMVGAREACITHCRRQVPERPLSLPDDRLLPVARAQAPSDDLFFRQLVDLAQSEPTANKWVFVPSSRWRHTLAERLTRTGCDWLNVRFVTPFELALEAAAPELISRGVEPKTEGLGPSLMMSLLENLPEQSLSYFRPLRYKIQVLESLWSTVWELRLAGVSSQDLPTGDPKTEEFCALYTAYEKYLQQARKADRATLLQTALECPSPTGPEDFLLEAPSIAWTPLERAWLDRLEGHRLAAWTRSPEMPRRFSVVCPHRQAVPSEALTRDRHLMRGLGDTPKDAAQTNDGTLKLFYAGRRDAEIEEVLRRVFEAEFSLDELEIVTVSDECHPLLLDLLAQVELECTVAAGIGIKHTRFCQAVLGLLDWLSDDFAVIHLRRLLLEGHLRIPDLSSTRAAHLLERSQVKRGRRSSLSLLRMAQEQAAGNDQLELAQHFQALAGWMAAVFDSLPDLQATVSLTDLTTALTELLKHVRCAEKTRELSAATVIRSSLLELSGFEAFKLPAREGLRFLKERLIHLKCFSERPQPGKIHVSSLYEVGLSGRGHTFILGMEEGTLHSNAPEDPVLGDAERAKIHPGLRLSRDVTSESTFCILERLQNLDGNLTLSFSSRDMVTGEETPPSWLFFEVARRLNSDIQSYDDLVDALGEPKGRICGSGNEAITESGWWLQRLAGTNLAAVPAVRAGFPWLERGHEAENQRESELFTRFEGAVPSLAGVLLPGPEQPASVSQLQDLATCAFRTFLKRGLRMRPIECSSEDGLVWLDPATRGTALHEVFASYHKQLKALNRSPHPEQDVEILRTLMKEQLDLHRERWPAPSAAVERQECDALESDLLHFLSLECGEKIRRVLAVEVGFGLPDCEEEELGQAHPLELDLGPMGRLWLQGRIDRIDAVEDGYEVIDYKTGGKLSRSRGIRYDGGRLIQHALYALAAEQLLGGKQVSSSSYYFPTLAAERAWLRFPRPNLQELADLLEFLLKPLELGAFPQTVDSKVCLYCDYKAACPDRIESCLKQTLDNPGNPQLEWRRRLDLLS